jgi:MraZ protein
MGLFLSTYVNKVDKKGRVSVPAPFRAALSGQNVPATEVILFKSLQAPALDGCSFDYIERLAESLDNPDMADDLREQLEDIVFGGSIRLPMDPEGRINLPDAFIAFAGIGESIAFVGRRKTFQLWDPQAFEAHEAARRDVARANNVSLSSIEARTASLRRGS